MKRLTHIGRNYLTGQLRSGTTDIRVPGFGTYTCQPVKYLPTYLSRCLCSNLLKSPTLRRPSKSHCRYRCRNLLRLHLHLHVYHSRIWSSWGQHRDFLSFFPLSFCNLKLPSLHTIIPTFPVSEWVSECVCARDTSDISYSFNSAPPAVRDHYLLHSFRAAFSSCLFRMTWRCLCNS